VIILLPQHDEKEIGSNVGVGVCVLVGVGLGVGQIPERLSLIHDVQSVFGSMIKGYI
jgi:hypothetical protein